MNKTYVNIIDAIEDKIIYPHIKDENSEFDLSIVRNSNLPLAAESSIYFPFEWRFSTVVLDSLAKKYGDTLESYPDEDEEEERFLLGVSACRNARSLECPYLKKVWAVLEAYEDFPIKDVFAIYLLEADESDDNNQKFIVLTKGNIYIRCATRSLDAYNYSSVVINEKGIQSKEMLELEKNDDEKPWKKEIQKDTLFFESIVDYPLAEEFIDYVSNFQLLRSTTLDGVDGTHPLVGIVQEKKCRYLEFLVEVANGAANCNASKLLRLEYLARELRVTANDLLKWLDKSLKKPLDDRKIVKAFNDLWGNVLTEDLRYVLYQDMLELLVSPEGELERKKLQQLLIDRAGDDFVEAYSQFVALRKQAERQLSNAMEKVQFMNINQQNFYKLLDYNSALNMQILKIGVKVNGN